MISNYICFEYFSSQLGFLGMVYALLKEQTQQKMLELQLWIQTTKAVTLTLYPDYHPCNLVKTTVEEVTTITRTNAIWTISFQ